MKFNSLMQNKKLIIEYDGTDFCGWQRQPNVRTVQADIEAALEKILQHPITLIGSGRTDVGVHALGQVAHVKIEREIKSQELLRSLNGVLPLDIRIRAVETVADDFHARFCAKSRFYWYRIAKFQLAVERQYVWFYGSALDVEKMNEAASLFIGTHDFRSFSKLNKELDNFDCTVSEAEWIETENELWFNITANRFLHKMVRTMVGTLVDVGRDKLPVTEITKILMEKNREEAGITAPSHGLFLLKVEY